MRVVRRWVPPEDVRSGDWVIDGVYVACDLSDRPTTRPFNNELERRYLVLKHTDTPPWFAVQRFVNNQYAGDTELGLSHGYLIERTEGDEYANEDNARRLREFLRSVMW